MTTYETVYNGGESTLNPSYQSIYQPITYKMDATEIGTTLDGRTANQLKDVGNKLHSGVNVAEVQATQAGLLESIPKQHFKEIGRQMKLAGAIPTMHGPIVEASGISNQGWSEGDRLKAEKQLTSALIRGNELDAKGNVSVTTHTTAGLPEMEQKTKTKEEGKEVEKLESVYIVNPKTGQINVIKAQKRFFPEKGEFKEKGHEFNAKEEIEKYNKSQWLDSLTNINRTVEFGEHHLKNINNKVEEGIEKRKTPEEIRNTYNSIILARKNPETLNNLDEMSKKKAIQNLQEYEQGVTYLRNAYESMKQMFESAYETSNKEDKQKLKNFAKNVAEHISPEMEEDPHKIEKLRGIIYNGNKILSEIQRPKTLIPLNDFVLNKSTQTFANAATKAYEKFGDKAPILNIENPPAGGGLSRAEDLVKIIKESRKKMAANLVEQKGLSKGEAKKAAEKMIGATWDVGHINMLRGKGYSEKDIIKETEKIAPYVKHVHLSDNFGYEHTELPMGMGNVPIKEIMQRLGEKGFKGKKIIEAIQWYEHFQDVPGQPPKGGGHALAQNFQAFDSPIFTTGEGYSWGQMPGLSAYVQRVGQGTVAPPVSQSMYGTAFSTLPAELGGQIGGDQSRFSGTPNQ